MSEHVLQTVPLGMQWPTIDPFLFCVHHDDAYPAGDEHYGPPADALEGREIGSDFEGLDGWRMYHGDVVPGFPGHPHRGFETVTYVRRGLIDHSDSLGAAARFGRGDTQWLTAGAGVVHSEMFPLVDRDGPNPLELFQIWLNLPAADKMVDPYFTMLWDEDIPRLRTGGDGDPSVEVTVIAGALEGLVPPPPPPDSWASRADADVAIWNLRFEAGASWTLPPAAGEQTVRTLYVYGGSVTIDGQRVDSPTAAVVTSGVPLALTAGDTDAEVLMLQGRPIAEPVAQYGPFVMNDEAGIRQAFEDYRRTEFGGWPWDDQAPVHGGPERHRFARHADGTLEERGVPTA